MRRYRLFSLILLAFLSVNWIVADELENRVRKIAHQIRCPTCQAMSVKESTAGLSVNMKQKIRQMLKEGKSETEILAYFEERYGEWILRLPKKSGFNLILWALPGMIILIAGAILIRSLRRGAKGGLPKNVAPLTKKEADQIDKELRKLNST